MESAAKGFWESQNQSNSQQTILETSEGAQDTLTNTIIPALFLVISCCGLVGNLLCIGLLGIKSLRKATDILVFNLAIADFVYCLGLPVMAVELFNHRQWILGSFGCKLMSAILLLNLYGSVYFLSSISVDRCLAVCCPLKARKFRTETYGWILAGVSWILAMGTSTQAMIYRRTRHYAHNSTYISLFQNYMCKHQKGENCEALLIAPDPEVYFEFDMCVWDFKTEDQSQNFLITKTICGFIVPFIIIAVSYILIAFRTSRLKVHRDLRCSRTNSIILIVVTSFFITWLPNHALNMYMVLKPPSEWSPKVFRLNPFTQVLAASSSMINPLIYGCTRTDLRQSAIEIFTKKFSCRRHHAGYSQHSLEIILVN